MPYDEELTPYADLVEPSAAINQLAHRVIGIAIDVHRELGAGLPEEAYERALAIEFDERGIAYVRQHRIAIEYKGRVVTHVRLDSLIESSLVLEAKACEALTPIDRRQVLRYLQVTKLPLGLLINFNVMVLKNAIHRIVRTDGSD